MARQLRIDYPGAVHHVMNRGADHQAIFHDDQDREMFLELWSQAVARFELVIVSYALMGNHFHFLVESPTQQLSRSLKFVSQVYTQRFNARHGRDGALFRGRFHSVLVDSDAYFERVGRYIELNPVAAGLIGIDQLEKYRWSSFQFYTGLRRPPSWLSTHRMLERYRHRHQYSQFVRSDMSDEALHRFYRATLRPGLVLGEADFVRQLNKSQLSDVKLTAGIERVTLDDIDRLVSHTAGCTPDALRSGEAGVSKASRRVAADLSHLLTNTSRSELASRYSYPSPDAVGFAIRSTRSSEDSELQELRTASLDALGFDHDGHRTRR